MSSHNVVVGLGSNIQPLKNLRQAVQHLRRLMNVKVISLSAIYESQAQVLPDSPTEWQKPFLNAAVLLQVENFNPLNFLATLKKVEEKMGRFNSEKWAPRCIDLDILYVAGVTYDHAQLIIPHTHLKERPFALLPALDVWPHMRIQRPLWAQPWVSEKPFGTKKSYEHFWPQWVGILNVTTDSFSDGGEILEEQAFLKKAHQLLTEGVEIFDVGAESTRPQVQWQVQRQTQPQAQPVDEKLEYQRLRQALQWLQRVAPQRPISLDCRHADVVEKILQEFKIDFLNDVTGFYHPKMVQLLASAKLKGVVMHSLSIPPSSQCTLKEDVCPTLQLKLWWSEKKKSLLDQGVDAEQLVFDPGIGFGKTAAQNHFILNHLDQLEEIQEDFFLGFSRKSFLKEFTSALPAQRDLASALQLQNINPVYCQYLRVHNIESHKIALRFKDSAAASQSASILQSKNQNSEDA